METRTIPEIFFQFNYRSSRWHGHQVYWKLSNGSRTIHNILCLREIVLLFNFFSVFADTGITSTKCVQSCMRFRKYFKSIEKFENWKLWNACVLCETSWKVLNSHDKSLKFFEMSWKCLDKSSSFLELTSLEISLNCLKSHWLSGCLFGWPTFDLFHPDLPS